jgi:hypothetical protein
VLLNRSSRRHDDGLRRCPWCHGGLVCPTAWEPCDDRHWHIDLRCPECEHRWERVVDDERAARLDRQLNGDQALLRFALLRLERVRTADLSEPIELAF